MDTFPLRLNYCFVDPAQSSHGTMLLELLVIRTDEEVCTRFCERERSVVGVAQGMHWQMIA